tara:strand:- start:181 stop:480 length:300 start_codon:yes stop_codon:yes gene_type:complete
MGEIEKFGAQKIPARSNRCGGKSVLSGDQDLQQSPPSFLAPASQEEQSFLEKGQVPAQLERESTAARERREKRVFIVCVLCGLCGSSPKEYFGLVNKCS